MADITRYDLELGPEDGAYMAIHRSGDYVEYSEHREIVEELQSQLEDFRKAATAAYEELRSVV